MLLKVIISNYFLYTTKYDVFESAESYELKITKFRERILQFFNSDKLKTFENDL